MKNKKNSKNPYIKMILEILCIFMILNLSCIEFIAEKFGIAQYLLSKEKNPVHEKIKDTFMVIFAVAFIIPLIWLYKHMVEYY